MEAINTDHLTTSALLRLNDELGKRMEGDCVFINSPMRPPLDDEFRVVLEKIKEQGTQDYLVVMLQTMGGFMETVERLVAVMRTHYKRVSFVIPNYAYSAGTVLALSGDSIYMDYYSVLGPIDPQVESRDGQLLPGLGILAKFDEICETINQSETIDGCRAELAYLIKRFDPEQLFAMEQAKQHGLSLITKWLPKYKFKDWVTTETKGAEVTDATRKKRAEEIAETLGDASRWHSHGRGISMQELSGKDLKLMIDDFGKIPKLSPTIRNYHGLAVDYFRKIGVKAYIHSTLGLRRIS